MKASELPQEILTHIADNLSTKDRLSCALTCKGWRYSFQRTLWKTVQANTLRLFKNILDTIRSSQNSSIPYGIWVHSLCMQNFILSPYLSDIPVIELFRCLPNLKCLYLGDIGYKNIYRGIVSLGKVSESLENLTIETHENEEIVPAPSILEFINTCSMLQKLEIIAPKKGYRIELSLDDFDNLHQNLKRLSFIKAAVNLNFDFTATLNTIPNTAPAYSVTTLDIDTNQWNPLWLYYFCYKYPNLRSLKLDVWDTSHEALSFDQKQRIISLFHSNPNALQHLETFKIISNIHFEPSDLVLWELICASRVPLKHLTVDAMIHEDRISLYVISVHRILQTFSETLQTLSVTGFRYNIEISNPTLELFPYCPFLTDLCISGYNGSFNLDDILDNCIALQNLKFHGGRLTIDPNTANENPINQQQHHELQKLTLECCSLVAEVLNRLSFRCRSLQYMTLNEVWISGSISEETGCFLVDMSYTFLKSLCLNQVEYHNTRGEMPIREDMCIHLTLLSQLYTNDSKYPIVERHNIAWIYLIETVIVPWIMVDYENNKLSEEAGNLIVEFYQNFPFNQSNKTIVDEDRLEYGYQETGWMDELYRGYGELRLGNIEAYTLG